MWPILSTDVGGVAEIVDGDLGFLLDANPTTQEIKQAILSFIQLSNQDQKTLKLRARQSFEQKWEASKIC